MEDVFIQITLRMSFEKSLVSLEKVIYLHSRRSRSGQVFLAVFMSYVVIKPAVLFSDQLKGKPVCSATNSQIFWSRNWRQF